MQDIIAIIDDDECVSESIRITLESINLSCSTFISANNFLTATFSKQYSCLISDIRMPYMSGLELFEEIKKRNQEIPTIFMTGYSDIRLVTQAMKAGALDVLEKPFHESELIDAVNQALRLRKGVLLKQKKQMRVCCRADNLTHREFEVFKLLIEGKFNKMIASELHLSPRTVERHRYNLMKKMEVKTLPDLVFCAQELQQAGRMS